MCVATWSLRIAVATLVLIGGASCPAIAGSYVASACSPSPSSGLWTATNSFQGGFIAGNLCGGLAIGPFDGGNHGGLYAEDIFNSPEEIPAGSRAGWIFTAPPGTTITSISYYRHLDANGNNNMFAGLYTGTGAVLEECKIEIPLGSPIACEKPNGQVPTTFAGLSESSIFLGVVCRIVVSGGACGAGGAPLHAVHAVMYSARVTLAEGSTPIVSGLDSALWGSGVVSGIVPVTFAATDPTGIKKAAVLSESGIALGSATQTCDETRAQPCPQLTDGSLTVDTRRVADGPQRFRLVVTDAADNSQVLTSATVRVDNGQGGSAGTGPAAGSGAGSSTGSGSTGAARTKISAVLKGRRLRVSGTMARTGRVKVSWRSKLRGRTLGSGSRVVTIRDHRVSATFMLSARSRKGTTRVAVRSGRRIVAQARARRA